MIDQNQEHFMGSPAAHCRPWSSAVRATSMRFRSSVSSPIDNNVGVTDEAAVRSVAGID
jgi:hypothetical protein